LEVGPTLKGANSEARTLAIKAWDQTPDEYRILDREAWHRNEAERVKAEPPQPQAAVRVASFDVA